MSHFDGCPPIYFSSLELQNVRCFGQRQVLSLANEEGNPIQWTLILGDNGVGKTTLLQCLVWMRPVPVPPMDEEVQFMEPALNGEENRTLDSLIRTGVNVSVTLKASLSVGRDLAGESPEAGHSEVTTEIAMQGKDGRLQDRQVPKHEWSGTQNIFASDLAMFAYGAARRPGTLKVDGEGSSDPLASIFRNSTDLYDAEDILLKLDYRAVKSGEPQDKERIKRVMHILAAVLPDIDQTENIEILGPEVLGRPSEPSGVRFKTPYGLVPASALSLGYQTTLTWITDLALRLYEHYPESSDPLCEPGIVLIDNIDLHLHPRWQLRMMKDLTRCFPAIQFVATAHSPLIAQAAEKANLVVLRNEGGQVTVNSNPKSVNAWRADQILASDLFDIPPRSKYIGDLIRERNELLDRAVRSQSDEARLNFLDHELDSLPTAEDPEDRAAMDLIRSVAASLKDGSHQP